MTNSIYTLKDWQQQFVASLTTASIEPTTAEQLSIYRNNNRVSLIKAMAETYPVCQRLVGKAFFQRMVNHYILENPSTVTNLNDYGENFSAFLTRYPKVTQLPYLADVAQLEWIIHQILLGPHEISFNWESLAQVLPERQINIVLHRKQNACLFHSDFPVGSIWETNQLDFLGDATIDLEKEQAVYLIIWRSDFDLRIDKLSKAQWYLLNMIDGQCTIGQLAAISALPEVKEQNIDAIALLPDLIKKGYIERFTLLDCVQNSV